MTIQHKDLPEAQLHEPKGASTALADQVYTSDGAGSGSWATPNYPVKATQVIAGRSYISQQPVGTDTALQLTFGSGQTTTDVDLSSSGAFTINTAGTYEIVFVLRMSRTTGAGEAVLGARWLKNGVTQGGPTAIRLADGGFTIPFSFTTTAAFEAGDVITAEIIRDSSGVDNGGLLPFTFTDAGWEDAASAVCIISKFRAEP